MFLDNTACNLASINLMKFRKPDGMFDVERFQAACRLFFIAQEILVDHASYPTGPIAENSHLYRPLGLGYSNLGSLLMTSGLPYDSEAAYGVCGSITALLHGAANLASAEMAGVVGPFEAYADNREPMLRVMQMHRDAVERIDDAGPRNLKDAARKLWDQVLAAGRRHGFRNAQATVLAPTGTISFMMDCDTTGIEPDIALVKYKQLAGGGMLKIVNNTVPLALRSLGYDDRQIEAILKYVDAHDTIEGAPELQDEHLPVFDCAFKPANGSRSIAWRAHIRMMAAAQPFLSGAISKTVNMPKETTAEEIAEAYLGGWKLGLKALAIYRDGSKQSQPLSTQSEGDKAKKDKEAAATAAPRAAARYAAVADAQVQRRRPRGLYQRGPVPGRAAGRVVHHDGQGGQHRRRLDGLLRHRHLDLPAVRRAAGGAGQQVLAHAVRADGPHHEPGCPHRQERGGLHLPLAGDHVPGRLPRSEQWPAVGRQAGCDGGGHGRAFRHAGQGQGPCRPGGQRLGQRPRPRGPQGGHGSARTSRRGRGAERTVRPLPKRCSGVRQLRRDHRPQRQLLPVPQLRQQHGLLVTAVPPPWFGFDEALIFPKKPGLSI